MTRLLTLLCIATLTVSPVAGQSTATGTVTPPLSPRNASYSIDAHLDPATRTITGSEAIAWRNISTRTADELQFHLYWNAWRDDRTTWMREAALGGTVYRNRTEADRGRIDIISIRLLGSGI